MHTYVNRHIRKSNISMFMDKGHGECRFETGLIIARESSSSISRLEF